MRACRHCSHQNADHLAYCSQCGKRMAGATLTPGLGFSTGRGQMAALSPTAAMSRTMLAQQGGNGVSGPHTVAMRPGAMAHAGAAAPPSRLVYAFQSIGYIYIFLRGKVAAGERRR